MSGDAAIVSMEAESKGTYTGKLFSEKSRGVDFFAKRDGRWQVVNSQVTTIKEQAAGPARMRQRAGPRQGTSIGTCCW